jgi:hypothetical protein
MEMITNLLVNGLELTIDYELDISAIYFGDLESEFVDIEINSVEWNTAYTEIDGNVVEAKIDILPIIQMMENEESLKIILRDRFEDIE